MNITLIDVDIDELSVNVYNILLAMTEVLEMIASLYLVGSNLMLELSGV